MYSIKRIVTAGIVTVALGAWPGAAAAQSSSTAQPPSTSPQTGADSSSQQPSGQQPSGQQPSGQQPSGQGQSTQGGGGNQEAIRQHLADARTALAELTKLPEAAQLQGQQRDQVASLISNFNAFATATTDWRSKYEVVDKNLDEMIGSGDQAAAAAPSPSPSADPSATPSSAGSTAAPETAASAGTGGFDPAIAAKLQEVRTHLNKFEEATGDPVFVVEKIEKILDQAAQGGSQAVGTSGAASSSAGAGGAVTLDASQISEIRRHLESIRTAAKQ
jgi:hypothetical protein